jgi:hypothetical protein
LTRTEKYNIVLVKKIKNFQASKGTNMNNSFSDQLQIEDLKDNGIQMLSDEEIIEINNQDNITIAGTLSYKRSLFWEDLSQVNMDELPIGFSMEEDVPF